MPTYEYKCFSCQHVFEVFQKISDEPVSTCPKCSAEEVKRLLSAAPFHLKGSGWYATDYGKNGNASSPSPASTTTTDSDTDSTAKSEKDSGDKKKETTQTKSPTEKKTKTKNESTSAD